MKANKYFDIKELVPKEVYEELGEEKSLALLDSRALKALEEVRELTKDYMMSRADALKGKDDKPTEEVPAENTTDKPIEKTE